MPSTKALQPTMRLRALEFRPRFLPTLATILVVAVTLALGRWQLLRTTDKLALSERYQTMSGGRPLQLTGTLSDPQAIRFQPVTVSGEFVPKSQIFIDNKVLNGAVGFYVITPLRIVDSQDHVLVNRGWVPRGSEYPNPPNVQIPTGVVTIAGLASTPSIRFIELSGDTVQGVVWQNLVLSRYQEHTGLKVLPIVVIQRNDTMDGLARVIEQPSFGVERHWGYAVQWFALSLTLVIIYVVVNIKRPA